jgi:hypothetical protein
MSNYAESAHRVQTAIAMLMEHDKSYKATTPKHLRVDIDMSKSDMSGLVRLLISKGIFTEDEYIEPSQRRRKMRRIHTKRRFRLFSVKGNSNALAQTQIPAMTITTAPKLEQAAEPIKAKAWINVDFTKDGRHFPFVDVVYDSEGEAKQFADTFGLRADAANEKFLRDCGCCAEITDGCARHLYFWPEYSHTLQLPAGKA